MASSRRLFVITSCALLVTGGQAEAACNMIPQIQITATPSGTDVVAAPTPTATPLYYGRMGTIDQPFVVPGNTVKIERRACDKGSQIPGTGTPPVVMLVLNAQRHWDGSKYDDPGSPRVLFVVSDDNKCDTSMVTACDAELDKKLNGDAKCIQIPASHFEVTTDRIRFPMPDLALTFGEFRSGAFAAMVFAANAQPPCAEIGKKQTCLDLLPWKFEPPANWHACIDELYEQDATCTSTTGNQTFRHVTLLPEWNDAQQACFAKTSLCTGNADELRFAPDVDGNLLVPMNWTPLLDTCVTKPCGFPIRGDLVPPANRAFNLPGNDAQYADKNPALQSFTADGFPLAPMIFKKEAATLSESAAIYGTADGPYSVLRIGASTRRCVDGGGTPKNPCRKDADCANGETCSALCVGGANDGKTCTNDGDCPSKGKCGRNHDLEKEFKNARWRLDRNDPKFFQRDPSPKETCDGSTESDRCVTYQMKVNAAFNVPTPTATSTPETVPGELHDALGGGTLIDEFVVSGPAGAEALAESSSRGSHTWMAAFVHRPPPQGTGAPELFIGRVCGATLCDKRFVDLHGSRAASSKPALSIVGDQLRILVEDPGAGDPGWLTRVLGKRVDRLPGGVHPVLMVVALRATREHAKVDELLEPVPVARVDLSNRAYYEPLREHASGATTFVSPAGRCIDDCTGKILPVPSICDPDADASACPPGSRCKRGSVVVTMDLATDRDGDGVPDALRAPLPERVATP